MPNELNHLGMCNKPIVFPLFKLNHLIAHVYWTKKHMKLNFHKVQFIDECSVMMDGPMVNEMDDT